MTNRLVADAAEVPAPISADGDVLVVAVSTSASGAIDVFRKLAGPSEWYELHADMTDPSDKVYVTIGASDVATPSAASTSGANRALGYSANVRDQMQFNASRRFLNVIGAAVDGDGSGFLRIARKGVDYGGTS